MESEMSFVGSDGTVVWTLEWCAKGDSSIPGKYCEIFVCYFFDISLNFNLSVVYYDCIYEIAASCDI